MTNPVRIPTNPAAEALAEALRGSDAWREAYYAESIANKVAAAAHADALSEARAERDITRVALAEACGEIDHLRAALARIAATATVDPVACHLRDMAHTALDQG